MALSSSGCDSILPPASNQNSLSARSSEASGGRHELQLNQIEGVVVPGLPAISRPQLQPKQPRPRGRPPGSGAGRGRQRQKALLNVPSEAAYNAAREQQQKQQEHHHQSTVPSAEWQLALAAAAAAGLMPPPPVQPPGDHHVSGRQQQPQQPFQQPQQQQRQHGDFGFMSPPRLSLPQLLQASPFLGGYSGTGTHHRHSASHGVGVTPAAVAAQGTHNQAGILAELESLKAPHIEGILEAHTATQQQRISQSALLDGPYDVAGIVRRVSQVGFES